MISRRSLACLLLTVFAGLEVVAQQITGSLRGTVVDPSGAVVQSAAVHAQTNRNGPDAHGIYGSRRRVRPRRIADWTLSDQG